MWRQNPPPKAEAVNPYPGRHKGKDTFPAYPAAIAKALAEQAARAFSIAGENRPNWPRPCPFCVHPKRVEIDYQILTRHSNTSIVRNFGMKPANAQNIPKHRDVHLMPLIESDVLAPGAIMAQEPYPVDAPLIRRGHWHLMQAYAIRADALKQQNLKLALDALREMRTIDKEMIQPEERKAPNMAKDYDGIAALLPSPPKEKVVNGIRTES